MYRVDISDRANYELDKILTYISEDLAAHQAAVSFVDYVSNECGTCDKFWRHEK